ncbi:MAG: hypothetical protein HQ488_04415 [Parcubacteria group bacterium]|nr:hypothetical protein [Parcubacteria group bacterium]
MTNSLQLKKAITMFIAAATILATAGLTAFVPMQASAASYGDLIMGETLSTVYYYGSDGQRYSFPNEKTYFSWYMSFDDVVQVTDEELADITLAGNIVYRPGSRWIKIQSDEKVYAVSPSGSIHWIEDEATAVGLAGDAWNTNIDDVPDVFFVDFTVGDSLTDAAAGYEGMLWTDGTNNYLVLDGMASMVDDGGANGYQAGFWLTGTGFDPAGLTAGTAVTAELASLTDAAQMVTTDTVVEAADVSVSISGSPSASTLIAGQGIADLLHVTLTNNSGSSVNLNTLTLTRNGVSSDTTLANIYLFDGYIRLTDAATISDGKVTFNDSSGLWTLAAGASATLAVRSDIAASTNGQTVGLSVVANTDLTFSSAGAASGSFPMTGSVHTIATSPPTFGTADFTGSTTPSAASIDPQDDYRVFERTLSVGSNELDLYAARFRNIGSIDADDISGWQLYVGGVVRGSTVAAEDADGYISFDLSADPLALATGNHQVKVLADVIGGSGRTVTVGLRNSADFVAMDQDYGQPVLSTVGASAFAAMDAGAQTINSGSLTFTKSTNSPSGDVTETASGVTLGSWSARAFGENMKVESLRFAFTESDGHDVTLRNGAVFLNGTQVGSTAGLEANAGAGTDYTSYTFGSSFIVVPGTPATLEIRADIYDTDGTDSIEDADTIIAEIVDMNTVLNVQQVTSGGYIDAPDGAAVTANTLTVTAASLSVAKNGAYADQTTTEPRSNYKIGSWSVTAGTSEGVNLTDINVDFDGASDTSEPAGGDMYNLYVMYGPSANMTTSSTKGTIAETANSWSINYALEAGETIYVDVYLDIDAAITTGEIIQAVVDVNGTSMLSGSSPTTNEITGQAITTAAGTFTEFNDDHPVDAIVAGNQEVTAAKYRFSAANETYTITEMKTSVASATAAGLVSAVSLYDGSTLVGTTILDEDTNTSGTFTGMSIEVADNASKTLTLKYTLTEVGVGGGTSQTDVQNTLESVKFRDSNGTETTEADTNAVDSSGTASWTNDTILGNNLFVFRSIPTVTHTDLTNSTLVNGQATDLYKFTVTADANGAVAVKQFKLTASWSDGGTADTLEVESLKLYKNGSDITTSVVIQDQDGASLESTSGLLEADSDLVVTWASEDTVSAGETVTYTVRGTPQGFRLTGDDTSGDSISLYLAQDTSSNSTNVYLNVGDTTVSVIELFTSAAAGNATTNEPEFMWSDNSASAHSSTAGSASTGDWHNGYLVKNLDLGSETWTK